MTHTIMPKTTPVKNVRNLRNRNIKQTPVKETAKNNKTKKLSALERNLQDFNEFVQTDGYRIYSTDTKFTHTSLSPSAKYYFKEADAYNFMINYSNVIKRGGVLTFTEKPGPNAAFRRDIDLKAKADDAPDRQYTEETILRLVTIYQDEIRKAVAPGAFLDQMLICAVFEKPGPRYESGKAIDGFHLHFPYFNCGDLFSREYMRKIELKRIAEEGIFKEMKLLETIERIVDDISGKTWLLYGSAKTPQSKPFTLSYVLDWNGNKISPEKAFAEDLERYSGLGTVEYLYPLIFSLRTSRGKPVLREEITKKCKGAPKRKRRTNIRGSKSLEKVLEDIRYIKDAKIMEMLNPERADTYDKWMEIGWILYNIGDGCDEALDMWIEFSRLSNKFEEGQCDKLWSKMQLRNKGMGSLLMLAKNDSPKMYKEWRGFNLRKLIDESLLKFSKPNEWTVSRVIHFLYKDRFLCGRGRTDQWFEFKDHRWHEMDDAISFKYLFPTEVVDLYIERRAELVAKQSGKDEIEKKNLEGMVERCKKIEEALSTDSFHNKVMKMCKMLFYDGKFLLKKDENKNLLGCENGVLDLELGIFRDGSPDDYITLSTGINYRHYTEEDDEVIKIREILSKVFINENLRNFYLDSVCSVLKGGNENKTFSVHTGDGDNAKSLMFILIEKIFGEYCIKFPGELLIANRIGNSGAARPELSRVRGKRIAICQEIAKHETINIRVLKELTGNDSFFVRDLFEKGADAKEIKPQFSLFCMLNDPPKIPSNDAATWNRIFVLDYESKFVKPGNLKDYPVPESEEEQFKMKRFKADLKLSGKLDNIAPAFLSILFDRYVNDYSKRGMQVPDEVRMSTRNYRENNDVFEEFKNDMMRKEEPVEGEGPVFLSLSELFKEFKTFLTESYHCKKEEIPDKRTVEKEFSRRLANGKIEKRKTAKGWYHWYINKEDGDVFEKEESKIRKKKE